MRRIVLLFTVATTMAMIATVVVPAIAMAQEAAGEPTAVNATDASSLFTVTSLVTLQGATAAALVVPNGFGILFGNHFKPWMRRLLTFIIALGIFLTVALTSTQSPDFLTLIVAILNGFLVFTSAIGVNAGLEAAGRLPGSSENTPSVSSAEEGNR
jgi:hypothetical protein